MEILFSSAGALRPGVAVVGAWKGGRLSRDASALDGGGHLSAAMKAEKFSGKPGETLRLNAPLGIKAPFIEVLGLGKEKLLDETRARALGGALVAALAKAGQKEATLVLESDLTPEAAAALAFGARLRAYRPLPDLRTEERDDHPNPKPNLESLTIRVENVEAAQACWAPLEALSKGVYMARDLTTAPANTLTPDAFIANARRLEALGCSVTVLNEEALAQEGLNLISAVGQGSANPPRLCLVSWTGAAASEPPLAFVGKGITFDTGGISLKRGGLPEMKGDMAGAAACLGAIGALAAQKAPVNAVAVLALAENMASGKAIRPGDVVTAYNGLTVEIIDTDAEGRLVLADALAYAEKTLKPKAMVDLATLTGSVVVALGHHQGGLFCADEALSLALHTAGEEAEEPLWPLPLTKSYDEALASEVADLRNCSNGRFLPDALHAARFLQHFAPETTPWAHLDIAGVTETDKEQALCPKGATGFGVRLLVSWALA